MLLRLQRHFYPLCLYLTGEGSTHFTKSSEKAYLFDPVLNFCRWFLEKSFHLNRQWLVARHQPQRRKKKPEHRKSNMQFGCQIGYDTPCTQYRINLGFNHVILRTFTRFWLENKQTWQRGWRDSYCLHKCLVSALIQKGQLCTVVLWIFPRFFLFVKLSEVFCCKWMQPCLSFRFFWRCLLRYTCDMSRQNVQATSYSELLLKKNLLERSL